tara:strand:+ start:1974 stop:2213 length:240 start_codon:yes stop_codon:yes gene_type:complete
MEEIIDNLNMNREELIKFLKEFISELEDGDYSSEDDSTSEDELEDDVIDESIKVKRDEKGFLSLDLEFKSSTINKDECK